MPYIITNKKALNLSDINSIKPMNYKMNDLGSVFTHYNKKLGKNVPTENKLPKTNKEDINNGKNR